MRWRTALSPGDPIRAARAVFALVVTSSLSYAAAIAIFSTGVHSSLGAVRFTIFASVLAAKVAAAWSLRFVTRAQHAIWVAWPFVWIASDLLVAAITRPLEIHAGLLLLLPAMYAARQLARAGAIPVIGACAAAMVVVAATSPAPRTELALVVAFDPIMVVVAFRLTQTGRRLDKVVADLTSRARTDLLTGLGTRQVLEIASDANWCAPHPVGQALLLIDIDHFKQLNDEHGHPAGDELLRQLADIVTGSIRPVDLPCRLGGDELAVLCHGISETTARQRADEIRRRAESQMFPMPDGRSVGLTVSVGVAHESNIAVDFARLYARADRALYEAKRGGRNRTVLGHAA